MRMSIEPLQPDFLIGVYAIHKFYSDLNENPNWVTEKERFRKQSIGERKCNDLEYWFTSPVLWDCASFFFEEDKCIERIRNVPFLISELYEIIHSTKHQDFDCVLNLTEEWYTMIEKDQEKLHGIKNVYFTIDKEEGEARELLAKRFAEEKAKADNEPNEYPRKIISVRFPFRLAYWVNADIARCLRFEIKKIEDENGGKAPPFDVVELLTTHQPIDLRLFENREILAPIIEDFMKAYLQKFREGSLFKSNVLQWELQRESLMDHLKEMQRKYGSRFFVNREALGIEKIELSDYKRVESLLALDQEKFLNIRSFKLQETQTMNKWEEPTRMVEIEIELTNVNSHTDVSNKSIASYSIEYAGNGQMEVRFGERVELTKLVGTEKELCRVVYECERGIIAWDEAYELIESAEPPTTNKEQIRKYRKKLTDAKERINKKVSAIAQKEVFAVTQDEEGNFVAALAAVTVR